MLQVMADVSAALPDESALRKERQARWDSDVSEGSVATEDKVRSIKEKQTWTPSKDIVSASGDSSVGLWSGRLTGLDGKGCGSVFLSCSVLLSGDQADRRHPTATEGQTGVIFHSAPSLTTLCLSDFRVFSSFVLVE